jgi:hypothetical protein
MPEILGVVDRRLAFVRVKGRRDEVIMAVDSRRLFKKSAVPP